MFGLTKKKAWINKFNAAIKYSKKHPAEFLTDAKKELIKKGQHHLCLSHCNKSTKGIRLPIFTRTDLYENWKAIICKKEWLANLMMQQSSNISESAHSVLWRYCPKEKITKIHALKAALTLTVIHINSGQQSVAKFLEELGFSIGNLESFYKKLDEESIRKSQYEHSKYKKKTGKKDETHYVYGGITAKGKEM